MCKISHVINKKKAQKMTEHQFPQILTFAFASDKDYRVVFAKIPPEGSLAQILLDFDEHCEKEVVVLDITDLNEQERELFLTMITELPNGKEYEYRQMDLVMAKDTDEYRTHHFLLNNVARSKLPVTLPGGKKYGSIVVVTAEIREQYYALFVKDKTKKDITNTCGIFPPLLFIF